ncbi:hypothetical protein RND71_024027 [Anisodus tanguticus]|uniref:Uncharacterized protein n=1 Tax=Anisodus tanguticus TaxID=243964 RepID=A0AAE1V7J7_9SOLA|nr:hypothetical protein RND71_024027 [Anisodus tanguticus]
MPHFSLHSSTLSLSSQHYTQFSPSTSLSLSSRPSTSPSLSSRPSTNPSLSYCLQSFTSIDHWNRSGNGSPRVGLFRYSNPKLGEQLLYFILSSLRSSTKSAKVLVEIGCLLAMFLGRHFREDRLVDKHNLYPPVPPLIRYKETTFLSAKKKLVESVVLDNAVNKKLDTLTTSKLCVRMNTLQLKITKDMDMLAAAN